MITTQNKQQKKLNDLWFLQNYKESTSENLKKVTYVQQTSMQRRGKYPVCAKM